MKPIENALEPITGYLFTITRNTEKGWYELTVGIPKGWVYNDNDEIFCEIINESEEGRLIKIAPKNENITVDDLVDFVVVILSTNEKIAQKEKEFTNEVEEMKKQLEEKARNFYKELDELKDNSFKKNSDEFVKSLQSQKEEKKKVGRPRKEDPATESTKINTTE